MITNKQQRQLRLNNGEKEKKKTQDSKNRATKQN